MRIRLLSAIAIGTLLLPACAAGTVTNSSEEAEIQLEQSDIAPPHSDISDVVEGALPSVVNVRVTALIGGELGQGQGSGVVIDPEGIILTNNHVIADAVEVTVAFTDGRRPTEGVVIGRVPEKDLAVIEVEEDDLTAIEIGRSSALRLGDPIAALGFPLGLGGDAATAQPTVTAGIISGQGRSIQPQGSPVPLEGLLQTDAAINPGNSGGPLIDLNGRLVGINTAAAGAASAENVGFAIAIDSALPVIEEILSEPPEERAWLGVSLFPVDSAAVAVQLELDENVRGALITAVFPGDPAETAGLSAGDVIVEIEGEEIGSPEDVSEALREFSPGDTVEVAVVGDDGSRTVEVELGQRPVPAETP
ncbi:MAG: S1C family serine protease [Actinomycetota bacterium]